MFGNIGPWELILILLIALVIIGPGKLPQVGKAIGRAVKEFRKAANLDLDGFPDNPSVRSDHEAVDEDQLIENSI